jgi:hypothetical protein
LWPLLRLKRRRKIRPVVGLVSTATTNPSLISFATPSGEFATRFSPDVFPLEYQLIEASFDSPLHMDTRALAH